MEAYSAEFRGEVLAACNAKEETRAIAIRFQVSELWVRLIEQQRREAGQLAPRIAAPRLCELVKLFPAFPWRIAFEELVGASIIGNLLRLGIELEVLA